MMPKPTLSRRLVLGSRGDVLEEVLILRLRCFLEDEPRSSFVLSLIADDETRLETRVPV